MRRREFIAVLGGAAAAIPLAPAAAQRRAVRIGWLVFGDSRGPIDQSLKDALVQRRLIEGRNIEIVHRYADGISARLPELAGELVAQKHDLLLGSGDIMKA